MKSVGSIIFLFFFATLAETAHACTCYALPPIYEAYQTSDAVFVGKVISSNVPTDGKSYNDQDVIFEIELIENFKGPRSSIIKLNRGSMASSCYSGYEVGATYLFYASSTPDGGFFEDKVKGANVVYQGSFCNRSSSLAAAKGQLTFLRELRQGKPESRVYGSVSQSDVDPATGESRYAYLQDVPVLLEGNKTYQIKTDSNGIYRFENIEPGEYVLKPLPPSGLKITSYPGEENLTVLPRKGIVAGNSLLRDTPHTSFYAEFSLAWENRLDGYVLGLNGVPVARYASKVLPIANPTGEIKTYVKDSPNPSMKNGYFVEGQLTPGKYVIAVDIYLPSTSTPKKRFYFPGVETVSDAKVFDITASSRFSDLQFKIPIAVRDVSGHIAWSDGTSVGSRGNVKLTRLENEDDSKNAALNWPGGIQNGNFSLQAFEGFDYWVQPSVSYFSNAASGGQFKVLKGKPLKVHVDENLQPLRFVFEKPVDFSCERINDCSQK